MDSFKLFLESQEIPDIFDAKSGIGQVPNNIDVDYFGFKKSMKPFEFRGLVPFGVSGPDTKEFVINALKEGKKLGQPFLKVDWDEENKLWVVLDHEGRSRVDAISKVYGQVPIEVHIFPMRHKAKHLTPEMKNAPFVAQDDNRMIKSFGLGKFVKSKNVGTVMEAFGDLNPLEKKFEKFKKHLEKKYPQLDILHAYIRNSEYIYVHSLRVNKDHRNQGIGSSVMNDIKQWAIDNELKISLTPSAERGKKSALDRFYKNLGFKKNAGRIKDFSISGTRLFKP